MRPFPIHQIPSNERNLFHSTKFVDQCCSCCCCWVIHNIRSIHLPQQINLITIKNAKFWTRLHSARKWPTTKKTTNNNITKTINTKCNQCGMIIIVSTRHQNFIKILVLAQPDGKSLSISLGASTVAYQLDIYYIANNLFSKSLIVICNFIYVICWV